MGAREDEDIAVDALFHPEVDRLSKTQDHDGDADEHGEGCHQGRDGDHGPDHRVLDIAACQFSLDSEKEAKKGREKAVEERGDQRNQKGDADRR